MIFYFLLMNILTLIFFSYDKFSAKNHKKRISEHTLLSLTLFGGTIGAVSGMFLFRHKISKTSFLLKFGVIILIQIILIFSFRKYLYSFI
ncbi:uncharacterized membrane protein YsdA (DUF1294 family) [Chryseobacterium defluvii]|uniref:Uncharacterized membrane protein YsdA (DUF1294 family) n=1 Tax=Chryseobacterium defluvii TaxID=160396 RepID=A0A840K8B0_9FLAO|nr:DUF1294 domain-containing protein [Chryseobacterium defluvii]MBB4805731.1 uncharacterized membrane protein YsdA (DUF1294 family) [Chryseobacterium defluvii]